MPSANSNVVQAVVAAVLTASVLQIDYVQGGRLFLANQVSWTDLGSVGAATYEVYSQLNGGGFSLLTTTAEPTVSIQDSLGLASLLAPGTYQYYVLAKSAGGATLATSNTVTQVWTATATPTFSPPAGTYSSTQTVAISCATAGALIFYTTDGSTPTVNSTPYTGPISVSSSQTVQAIATNTPLNTYSAVGSAVYSIVATTTFSITAGDQSTSPVAGYGAGEGYYDGNTNGGSSCGSSTPTPVNYGGNAISVAAYVQNAHTTNTIMLAIQGTLPQSVFTTFSFTDKFSNHYALASSGAFFSTSLIPGYSIWQWPTIGGSSFPFANGSNYSMTVTP